MVLKYKNTTNEKLHDKRRKKEEILANIEELVRERRKVTL